MSLSKLAKKTAQTAKNIGETLRAAFRGKITLVVSPEPIQRVQLSGLADETLQDLEHLQEYGFASHPPDGSEAVVIPLGGNTSHGVIVCSQHGSYRIKNLKPGETAIFNHEGAKIVIKQGKIIEADCDVYRVNCKQYEVNAATDAKFNAPLVETSAVLTAQGQINGNGGMAVEGGDGATFSGDVNQTGGSFNTDGDVVAGNISLRQHPHTDSIGGKTLPAEPA
ncbi:phage baseplate assembly protein V [Neisseria meningitidis]|uniref:phage baseplate assembly protein V n=1 Tax=Neisseria meningitidis TaxID=487 RepID=UPI000FCCC55D|nr:phage baseplate assembly protein V [Neisseria meningitidis]